MRHLLRHLADHRPAPGRSEDRGNPDVHHAEPLLEPGLYGRHFPGRRLSTAALPRLHGPRRTGPLHRLGIPQGPGPGAGSHLPAGDDTLHRRRPRQDPRFHGHLSDQPGPDDHPLPPAHLRRRPHSGYGRYRYRLCHHHRVVAVLPALRGRPAVDGAFPLLPSLEPPAAFQLVPWLSSAGAGHPHLHRRLLRNEPVLHRRPAHGRIRHLIPGSQPGGHQFLDPDLHPAMEHQPDGYYRHRLRSRRPQLRRCPAVCRALPDDGLHHRHRPHRRDLSLCRSYRRHLHERCRDVLGHPHVHLLRRRLFLLRCRRHAGPGHPARL